MADFKDHFIDAMREADMSDDQIIAALDKLASNEKVSKKINGIFKTATEDYKAQVERSKSLQKEMETAKPYLDAYPALFEFYQKNHQQNGNGGGNNGGNGNGNGDVLFDPSKFEQDLLLKIARANEANNAAMAARWAGVLKTATHITARHAIDFQEAPDMEAIDKIATERGLPIDAAYNEWIKPRVEAKQKEKFEKEKKEYADQILREYQSKHKIPIDVATPQESGNPFLDLNAPRPEKLDVMQELVGAWNSAGKKS